MDRPVNSVPRQTALRSVHRFRHPTCPSARLAACVSPHRPTWLASAPFRAQHPLVSGRLSRAPPRREGGPLSACSRCLSAAGIRFTAILSRLVFRPSRDRPTARRLAAARRTMTGFPRSAHTRRGRIGRPLYPGTSGALTGRHPFHARRLPSSTGKDPFPRRFRHLSGVPHNGASTRVQAIRPPGLPLARDPRMTREPLRLLPRAPHPRGQDPRTHAGAGTGSEH
jgi:hypothetical protein